MFTIKQFKLRPIVFSLHRYIGLAIGLLLVIAGLTGSLLVFADEIDHFLLARQIGHVIPQGQQVSIESVLNTVKTAYSNHPELKVERIYTLPEPDVPYRIWLLSSEGERTEINVNPYTGAIMGSRVLENTLKSLTLKLHYELFAGDVGIQIMGVVALLLFILCITGIILWPGWKRLISGFKIKWNAHPRRVNFDIHKVSGIILAVFLGLISFTGFCWNFYDFTQSIIYALTSTPNPSNLVSQNITGKSPLNVTQLLQKADAALPDEVTTYVLLPTKPEDAIAVGKKLPQESWKFGYSQIYLDQYTGEILRLKNGLKAPLGEKIWDSFGALHYGTFGGLPTRILYVFVGLAPLILFITGFVMWRYRYRTEFRS
ncbi:MAG: PepSY-associated TM helix domain-containing protein [Nostoc sp.]|uniref:PepSY-associated TM helix domain-containing protein n=1 Tax=Nostoc sp. TaxID=1180 RepID=UPI002FFCD09A